MNNFYLVNGEVKFLTHKVEYKQKGETIVREFYDEDKKNAFVDRLQERGIDYTEIPYEQPPQEVIDKVQGRKFNTIAEARGCIDGTGEPTKEEIIQSMALAIAELDAELQALKGGGK